MKRFTILLFATWLVAGVAGAQDFDGAGEAAMLARINAMRAAENLPALQRNGGLDAAARAHSADMATQQQLTHVSESSGTPADRVRGAGVTATTIAENVALHQSAVSAHEALLGSEPHRRNMLSESVTHVGLAALPTEQGVYVTQIFAAIGAPPAAQPTPSIVPQMPAPSLEVSPLPEPPAADAVTAPVLQAPIGVGEPAMSEPAPNAPSNLRVQAGTNGTVVHELDGGQVAAYWVYGNGRWWYYRLPQGAQPGQQLQVDPNVAGPPPGFPEHPPGAPMAAGPVGVEGPSGVGVVRPLGPGPQAYAVGPQANLVAPPVGPGQGSIVISPGGAFYAVPPPPMVGTPDRNWQRAHRAWLRRYRRWQRQQRRYGAL